MQHNAAAEMADGDWCTAQPGGGLLIASPASAGVVDAIMDVMSDAGCIEFADQKAHSRSTIQSG